MGEITSDIRNDLHFLGPPPRAVLPQDAMNAEMQAMREQMQAQMEA